MSAYDYDGGAGSGAFNAFGAIAKTITDNNTATTALETRRTTIATQFPNADIGQTVRLLEALERQIEANWRVNEAAIQSAQLQLIETTDAEDQLPAKTPSEAVKRIVELMVEDSQTFTESTPGGSAAYAAGNTGSGKLIIGTVNADGNNLQQIRAEDVLIECVRDAQSPGSIVAGEEMFSLKGENALPREHHDWPAGSGMRGRIQSTHGGCEQRLGPNQNQLKNGDFETWASGAPVGWTEDVQGSRITEETSVVFRGSSSLLITGDGSTLAKLSQNLDGTDGMKAKARRPYLLSIWARSDGTVAAGALKVSLQDGAGSILTDDGSNNIEVAIDATALTTSYVNYAAIVWMPQDVHASAEIVIEETTAVSNTEVIYLDDVVFAEAVQPHPAGPQFGLVAGATNWTIEDLITATITNDWTADTWNRESDRLFGTYEAGEFPPTTSGVATILDSIIA